MSRNEGAKRGMCLKAAVDLCEPDVDPQDLLWTFTKVYDFVTSFEGEKDTNEDGMQLGAAFHIALANTVAIMMNGEFTDELRNNVEKYRQIIRFVQGKDIEELKSELK